MENITETAKVLIRWVTVDFSCKWEVINIERCGTWRTVGSVLELFLIMQAKSVIPKITLWYLRNEIYPTLKLLGAVIGSICFLFEGQFILMNEDKTQSVISVVSSRNARN